MSDSALDLGAVARAARAWLEWHESNGSEGFAISEAPPYVAHDVDVDPEVDPEQAPAQSVQSARFDKAPRPARPTDGEHAAVEAPAEIRAMMISGSAQAPMAPNVAIPRAPKAPVRALSIVAEDVSGCVKCGLAATRTNTVFSRGNPEARIVFVGEAPGQDEDEQGIPFVGRAGQLLDKMIGAMGLSPERDVYVCNIIKCRPPENRRPEPEEIATCIPYLHDQLGNVEPEVIVAMGNTAVQALLGTTLGITKVRGAWKLYQGSVPVMPTYHPSYLLRPGPTQHDAKRHAWEDLQQVMKKLGLAAPKKS